MIRSAQRIVAVTGASGFIGRHLCEQLQAIGLRTVRLSRANSHLAAPEYMPVDYSLESLRAAFRGVNAVAHLAGRRMNRGDDFLDLEPFFEPNVNIVRNVVLAAEAAKVRRVVLASTIGVYSQSNRCPYSEEHIPVPGDGYGLSKLFAEKNLNLLTRSSCVSAVSLRLAATYGHGEKATPALMKFIGQALRGEPLVLNGDPRYVIDQLYVKDAVSAIELALNPQTRPGVYNIGGGRPVSIREIAESVLEVFGSPGTLDDQSAEGKHAGGGWMSIQLARKELGWHPRYSLRDGLLDLSRRQPAETKRN